MFHDHKRAMVNCRSSRGVSVYGTAHMNVLDNRSVVGEWCRQRPTFIQQKQHSVTTPLTLNSPINNSAASMTAAPFNIVAIRMSWPGQSTNDTCLQCPQHRNSPQSITFHSFINMACISRMLLILIMWTSATCTTSSAYHDDLQVPHSKTNSSDHTFAVARPVSRIVYWQQSSHLIHCRISRPN